MIDTESAPQVIIGGIEYPVLPVAFREVSKILPLVDSTFKSLRSSETSEAVFEGMGKIVYYGIKRAVPELNYEDFIDRHATFDEMLAAVFVVCAQAGLKKKETDLGEVKGQ